MIRAAALLLVALLGVQPTTAYSQDSVQLTPLHTQAIALYRAKNYNAAVPLYRRLATQMPGNPDVLQDLLWTLWYAEHFDEAIDVATRLTQLRPEEASIWSLLGRCYYLKGRREEALSAFEKSLSLDPGQTTVVLDVARVHIALRNYKTAIHLLKELHQKQPDVPNALVDMAKAQYWDGQYAEAAKTWTRVVVAAPSNPDFRFQEAQALYFAGKQSKALLLMKNNLAASPTHSQTRTFLIDAALAREDAATAESLLLNATSNPASDDAVFFRLAALYQKRGHLEGCVQTMERLLEAEPDYGQAMLVQADCMKEQGNLAEAATRYQRVLQKNPWSFRTLRGLADLERTRNRIDAALKYIGQARKLDPTDPYLVFQQAQLLYAKELRTESNALVAGWIKANIGERLPVLLYHGITPHRHDPMLAHPIHIPVGVFEEHMRALKTAGYTPITAAVAQRWIEGKEPLPKRPILITFDDARLDSFRFADPILKKYGLKATMTVPVLSVTKNLPGFASWDQLKAYQRTGRWEMQSHGNEGHIKIPVGPEGRKALFTPNKRWLEKEKRLETTREWETRIIQEMKETNRQIASHLGRTPIAFAFAEGDYGQDNVPNFPEAAGLILKHARTFYGSLYSQDAYGINVRTRDPGFLRRLEPSPRWKGKDLLRHLTDKDPMMIAQRMLLRRAAWEGNTHEAAGWLNQLRSQGASRAVLWADEARIRSAIGDRMRAWDLASRALELDPEDKETQQLLKSLKGQRRWAWSPEFEFFKDNKNRENWLIQQRLERQGPGNLRWNLRQFHGYFSEGDLPSVIDDGGGAGLSCSLGIHHLISLQGGGHAFSAPARSTYFVEGALESRWKDYFETLFRAVRAPYPTARALNANVKDTRIEGRAQWSFPSSWTTRITARAADISDGNGRYGVMFEISRALGMSTTWRALYRLTGEHTERFSPNYYSPQELHQHQIGLEYKRPLGRSVRLNLQYLPGFGDEKESNVSYVHAADVNLQIRLGHSVTVVPSFAFTRTPSYRSESGRLVINVNF